MSQLRSALVFVIDRLGARHLGPYGNSWVETPAWNRFASESLLWEHCLSDSTQLTAAYRSYWQGIHRLGHAANLDRPSIVRRITESGIHSALVTDAPDIRHHSLAADFATVVEIPYPERRRPSRTPDDCHSAQFAIGVSEALEKLPRPCLIWAHSCGLEGPWDAPLDLRKKFGEEGDPEPYDGTIPPAQRLTQDFDPDQLFAWSQAYAAQVTVLDMSLGFLADRVSDIGRRSPDCEFAVALTSPRGYPLGEHLYVGDSGEPLYGELLHVPLLWKSPSLDRAGWRFQDLVQPPDLSATLLDWFGLEPDEQLWGRSLIAERIVNRSLAVSVNAAEVAVRSPAWHLYRSTGGTELYVKPDDRFEVNDVANRCPSIVEQLDGTLAEFHDHVQRQARDQLPALDASLV